MLAITLVFSPPCLFGLLWLLNTFTKYIIYACLPFFTLIPIFMNVLWFVACVVNQNCKESFILALWISAFLFIFAFCGVIVWVIYANRDSIELHLEFFTLLLKLLEGTWGCYWFFPG